MHAEMHEPWILFKDIKHNWTMKGDCHFVGYQPDDVRKNPAQKASVSPQVEDALGKISRTSLSNNLIAGQPILEPGAISLNTTPLDQICEENIQLFMSRCQEYKAKQVELKQTIEELEEELAGTTQKTLFSLGKSEEANTFNTAMTENVVVQVHLTT